MKIPNYLFEEFVDNNIFNTGFAQVLSAIQEFPSLLQFFIPGVIAPGHLTFGFNGNLTVTVTPDNTGTNPFRCLFSSGAIPAGHGITTGVDSDIYSVNFAGLVPGIGSVTAYIVAQYAQVLLDSTVILGAPPGHPDYSANFVPYVGYTRLQDTLNIFATTTPPDNQTTMELARTTLTAGQTSIVTVDTSNQRIAALNINSGAFGIAGDVTGTLANTIVQRSSAATFFANAINAAGNIQGASANILGNETIGGNLTLPSPSGTIQAGGDIISFNSLIALGQIFGANASAANAATMLQQFGGKVTISGPNTTGHFTVPLWTGTGVQLVYIEFGSVQPPSGFTSGQIVPVTFPVTFPNIVGIIMVDSLVLAGGAQAGTVIFGSTSNTGFQFQCGPGGNTGGFYWFAVGI